MENKYTGRSNNIFNNKYTKKPVQSKLVTIIMTMVLFVAVAGTAVFAVLLSPTNLLDDDMKAGAGEGFDITLSDWNDNVNVMAAVADKLQIKYKNKDTQSLMDALGSVDESKFETIDSLDLSSMQLRSVPPILAKFGGLKQLNISNNFIFEMPEFIKNNPDLQLNCESNLLSSSDYDNQYELHVTQLQKDIFENMTVSKIYDEDAVLKVASESLWLESTTSSGTFTKSRLFDGAKFEISYNKENADGNGQPLDSYINAESGIILKSGIISGYFRLAGATANSPNMLYPFNLRLEADTSALIDPTLWEDNIPFIDYLLKSFNLQSIDQMTKPMVESIKEINIGTPDLISLPEGILEMKFLEKINVSGTRLSNLPDLSSLEHLREINISNTGITGLNSNILALDRLEILDASNNIIENVSGDIGNMSGLGYLYLNNNSLTDLPDAMANLSSLTKLDISNNNIAPLPSWLAGFNNFTLIARNNGLYDLPEGFTDSSIIALDISGNNFYKIPESIFWMKKLNNLTINDNQIVDSSRFKDGWKATGNILDSTFDAQRSIVLDSDDVKTTFEFVYNYYNNTILDEIVPQIKLSDGSELAPEHDFEIVLADGTAVNGGKYVDSDGNILSTTTQDALVRIVGASDGNENASVKIKLSLVSSSNNTIDDDLYSSSEIPSSSINSDRFDSSSETSETVSGIYSSESYYPEIPNANESSNTDSIIGESSNESDIISGYPSIGGQENSDVTDVESSSSMDLGGNGLGASVSETAENITHQIKESPDKVVKVELNDPTILDKLIFDNLQNTSKRLEVDIFINDGFSYSWTFDAEKITNPKDVDLDIDLDSENKSNIDKIASDGFVFIMSFAANGNLPGDAEVTVNIPDVFDPQKEYYIYYYNDSDNTAEYIDQAVIKDDSATFNLSHNSDFFISDYIIPGAKNIPTTGGWSMFTPINIAMIMLLIVILFTIVTGVFSFFPKKSFVTVMPTDKPYYNAYRKITNVDERDNVDYSTTTAPGHQIGWETDYSYDFRPKDDNYSIYKNADVWLDKDEEVENSEFLGETIIWCSDDSLNYSPENDFNFNDDDDDYGMS